MAFNRELSQFASFLELDASARYIGITSNSASTKVGVGTATPDSKFVVVGDARITGIITAANFKTSGEGRFEGPLTGNVTGNVTGNLTGNADTATALQTARTFQLTGDVASAAVSFDGTGNVSIAATIQPNSVALGTDTTGNYVATVADAGSSDIVVNNSGTETAAVTIGLTTTGVVAGSYGSTTSIPTITVDSRGRVTSVGTASVGTALTVAGNSGSENINLLAETLSIVGAAGSVATSAASNTITVDLVNTAVTPGSYGSSTQIPTFTVDAKGRLTAAGTASVGTALTVAGDSGSENIDLLSEILTISGGTNLTSSASANGVTINLDPSIDLTSVKASGIITAAQFVTGASGQAIGINTSTISGPAEIIIDPAGVGDNTGAVRIKGDLFVDGVQTVINSTTIELADFIVGIASTATTDALADGAGIKIGPDNTLTYDNANTALKSSENFNLASGKTYKINGTDVLSATSLTITNVNASGVVTATSGFSGNLTGNVTGNLTGTATNADNIKIATNTSDDSTYYVPFESGIGYTSLYIDTALMYNPGQDLLSLTNVQGTRISLYEGINASGVITASSFVGNLTGTASTATAAATAYGLSGTPNVTVGGVNASSINVSGLSTFVGNAVFQSNVSFGDGDEIRLGASDDLKIVHSASGAPFDRNRIISSVTSSNVIGLAIESAGGTIAFTKGDAVFGGGESIALFKPDGAVELYYDNAKKFETTGVGATVFGTLVSQQINVSGVTTSSGGFVGNLTGNSSTATALQTARTFQLTGDVASAAVSFDGTGNVSIAATIQPNSVALGTDTTGNYVATVADAGSSDIVVSNSGSETAAVTLGLSTTGVTAGSYGSSTQIPTFTVDSRGRLTAAGTASVGAALTVTGDSGSETINFLNESLSISGGTNLTSSAASNSVTINLDPNISLTSVVASGVVTATSGFSGNLTGNVTGNLTGTATNADNIKIATNTSEDAVFYVPFESGIGHTSLYIDTALMYNPGQDLLTTTNITATSLSVSTINASGIVTASSFSGPLTGNVTGEVNAAAFDTNASGVVVTGVATATSGFSGNLTGNVTGNSSTATALQTARTFQLTGDVASAAVSFDGTGNVSIAATIQPNSVELGTDTTGNYVATVSDAGSSDIVVSNSGSETAAVTLGLSTTGVTAGSYGSSTQIPTFTVDSRGRLTVAGVAAVGTALTVAGDSGSENINLLTETLTISGGTNLNSSASGNSVTVNLDPAIDLTSVVASGIITAAQFVTGASGQAIGINTNTITGPAELTIDPAAVGDNTGLVRIKGDLYVDGDQFFVNSTTIELADFVVGVASTAASNAVLDGAGIGIGSANIRKTITWNNTSDSLKSSENFDLASGKVYKINGTEVLSANSLSIANVNASGIVTATGGFIGSVTGNVTGNLTGNANTATALQTARTFQITGDVASAAVSFDGTGNVGLAVTIQPNSVALGTDTTGNYVATVADAGSSDIVVSNSGSETAAVTLGLSTTGVSAGSYGSTTQIPTFTVDSRGRLTAAGTAQIGAALTVTGDSGSETINFLSENLAISGGTNLTSSAAANAVTIDLDPNISLTSVVASGVVTATSGFSGNLTGNVTGNVAGNLTGNVNATSGISTFNNIDINGTLTDINNSTGTSGYILKNVGTGVSWADISSSLPTLRTTSVQTATSGQTSFSVNYTVGFLDVFINGVKLAPSEFTANNGTGVTLSEAAFAGDIVEFYAYNTLSAGVGSVNSLNDLSDVTLTSSSNGQLLQYNGSEWVNSSALVGINSVDATTVATLETALGYAPNTFNSLLISNSGVSTFTGAVNANTTLSVTQSATIGSGVTITSGGINAVGLAITAASFYGDGANLTNTGSTLSAASGVQRVVLTSLTSGTMVTSSTDGDLTFDANSNTLIVGGVSVAGVVTASDFNSTSDRNLKDNIRPIENASELVGKLEGVHFTWKSSRAETCGVVAQQIEEHLPQLVQTGDDHKTVNYNGLVGVLIAAVREQGEMIAALKAEIEELKK